jgi:hypothetical protein
MHDEYRREDESFIEREARRMLLCYIKPIINGTGYYFLEPEIRGGRKIDLVVLYEGQEFIVEVKIWRGEAYEQKGFEQLAGYVKDVHGDTGYLVSFCDRSGARHEGGITAVDGIEIHEVIVVYKEEK